MKFIFDKIKSEKLLFFVFIVFLITIAYTERFPHYSLGDFKVLLFLYSLMVVVEGFENSGFSSIVSSKIKNDKFIGEKLIITTAVLSSFITNDVALITMVPLTIVLSPPEIELVIIFETIAVNAFSSITPFGNPQNLFIYIFYEPHVFEFIKTIAPLSLITTFVCVIVYSLLKKKKLDKSYSFLGEKEYNFSRKSFYIYVLLFFITVFSILQLFPFYLAVLSIAYSFFWEKRSLKVDYPLLLIFFFFFGITDNLLHVFKFSINIPNKVFIYSSLLSQLVGNVSSALFFADFTKHWKALLWGVTAGGFGTLFSSFANIIAYRIYKKRYNGDEVSFLKKFHVVSFSFLAFSYALFYLIN